MKKKALLFPLDLQYFATNGDNAEANQETADGNTQGQQTQETQQETQAQNTDDMSPESLLAQLAESKATIARLKNEKDKLCASEGSLRKQLRAKQTAEEQEAEAKAEQQAAHEEYVKGLEKKIALSEATAKYLEMGMDKQLAEDTALADVEGNRDVLTANIQKYQADWKKATEAAIRQEYLDKMPIVQSSNGSNVDYSKQFNDAINSGDRAAAALAILKQSDVGAST